MRRIMPIVILFTSVLAGGALASGKLGYGSRVGMQVTVIGMSGLDTANAVIRTKHTREDAIEFCREYVGEGTEDCIKRELETRLNDAVYANCLTGVFTNFWGDRIQYRGRNKQSTEFGPNYILVNLNTGKLPTDQVRSIIPQTW